MRAAARVRPGGGRGGAQPGLHPHLAGAVRAVVVGRAAGHAAGADVPAAWFPLNVYDWACWARQTVVPLTIVGALRPVRPLPFGIDELRTGTPPGTARRRGRWAGAFQRLDAVLHALLAAPAAAAARGWRCAGPAEWIVARQEADGSWGGIQPPWVYSLIALHLLGYPLDHPAMAAGLRGLEASSSGRTTPTGRCAGSRPASRRSGTPALAVTALLDAGVAPDDPGLVRRRRLAARRGDPVRRATGRYAGPGWRPAAGRSSSRTTATRTPTTRPRWCWRCGALAHREPDGCAGAVDAGVAGRRDAVRDGGWGAFDADNTRELADEAAVLRLRRGDRSAVGGRDGARGGDAGRRGPAPTPPACRRGVALAARRAGARRLVVRALGRQLRLRHRRRRPGAGRGRRRRRVDPRSGAAVGGSTEHQNADGGWGEDLRSYDDPAWVGRGDSTASQTAWALLALLAAGERLGDGATGGRRLPRRHAAARRRRGTSRSSPAPASPATSTSTTTSTGWCSRSRRSAAT